MCVRGVGDRWCHCLSFLFFFVSVSLQHEKARFLIRFLYLIPFANFWLALRFRLFSVCVIYNNVVVMALYKLYSLRLGFSAVDSSEKVSSSRVEVC